MSSKKNNTHKYKPHEPKAKSEINSFSIDKKLVLKLSFIIALVAFLLYSNTLKHQFVLDDYSVIKENQLTKGGTGSLKEIFVNSYREGYGNMLQTIVDFDVVNEYVIYHFNPEQKSKLFEISDKINADWDYLTEFNIIY